MGLKTLFSATELGGLKGLLRILTGAKMLWFLVDGLTVRDILFLEFSMNLESCLDLISFFRAFLASLLASTRSFLLNDGFFLESGDDLEDWHADGLLNIGLISTKVIFEIT